MSDIHALLPEHKAGLHLAHNEHRNVYESITEWIESHESQGWFDWVNEGERQKAIDTDSVWTLQWYPETPAGFCCLAASDLNVLLTAARKEG